MHKSRASIPNFPRLQGSMSRVRPFFHERTGGEKNWGLFAVGLSGLVQRDLSYRPRSLIE